MKIECMCGFLVSDATTKYVWSTMEDKRAHEDCIDQEIENLGEDAMKEEAIMRIRRADESQEVHECPNCGRLMTYYNGELYFLTVEKEPL